MDVSDIFTIAIGGALAICLAADDGAFGSGASGAEPEKAGAVTVESVDGIETKAVTGQDKIPVFLKPQ